MKLFIPACGNRIKLTSDWTFTLYFESRNFTLLKLIKGVKEFAVYGVDGKLESVTMPAGTTLEVDRVYIRQFSKTAENVESDYDSLTFKVLDGKYAKTRFWAKLSDVNNIECELPPDVAGSKCPPTSPKKMKIEKVRDEIKRATWYVTRDAGNDRWDYMHRQAWRTLEFVTMLRKILTAHANRRRAVIEAELLLLKDVKDYNETRMAFCKITPESDVERKRALTYELRNMCESFLHDLPSLLDEHAVKPVRDDQGRLIRKWVGNTARTKCTWRSTGYVTDEQVCLVKDVALTITMTPDESAIESVMLTCGEEL